MREFLMIYWIWQYGIERPLRPNESQYEKVAVTCLFVPRFSKNMYINLLVSPTRRVSHEFTQPNDIYLRCSTLSYGI